MALFGSRDWPTVLLEYKANKMTANPEKTEAIADRLFEQNIMACYADVLDEVLPKIECPDASLPDVIRSHLEAAMMGLLAMADDDETTHVWHIAGRV